MAARSRNARTLVFGTLALLLAAPLLAAPPAPAPRPTMVLQVGHTGVINSFAYSSDGQTLATGGDTDVEDGVRLWDAASGQLKATLPAGSVFAPPSPPTARCWRPEVMMITATSPCSSGTWRAGSSRRL